MKMLKQYLYNLRHRRPIFFFVSVVIFVALLISAIVDGIRWVVEAHDLPTSRSWSEIRQSDTLRVVTVSASTTAFKYRDQWHGHEYEMAAQVARGMDLQLQVLLAPDVPSMVDSLNAGVADVAIWPMNSAQRAKYGTLRPCGLRYEVGQSLIGRKLPTAGDERFTLCVLSGSPQWAVLEDTALYAQFPLDRLDVVLIADSALQAETLVDWVAEGQYDLTLVETNRAQLFHTYHRQLKVSPLVAGTQDTVAWVVRAEADTLAWQIDSLCGGERAVPQFPSVVKRYYENVHDPKVGIRYLLGGGQLSVYDSLFRKYAAEVGWDWRLLAAIAFVESRFDPYVVSTVGARGLMQLMPSTAEAFGCPSAMITDPETNIAAGSRLLNHLRQSICIRMARSVDPTLRNYAAADSTLRSRIEREVDQYVIAGFHSGLGHIYDAITLADSLGYDPLRWHGNVEQCMILKQDSAYFTLPYVKLGRYAGRITAEYVEEVMETYDEFREVAK
jgi:membrane-bound lytic murein transglycosylase F